jgi:hypothetical protein
MERMSIEQFAARTAVQGFTYEWTSYRRHMKSDLMGSAGVNDDLHDAMLSSTVDHRDG